MKVIKKLLDTGVSLQRVRKAVELLRSMDRPPHGVTLMSDGTGVYEAHSPEAVVDLLNDGQGVFAISLDAVYSDLEDTVARVGDAARAARGQRVVSGPPATLEVPPLKSETIRFAHASERQFAKLLDFYGIDWEYEPTSFDIDFDGKAGCSSDSRRTSSCPSSTSTSRSRRSTRSW